MVFPPLDPRPDIRLIAVDMDGTLLDPQGRPPAGLWELLDDLAQRGIAFAPASGRQYATLRREFGAHGDDLVFIAENGAYVAQHDRELSAAVIDRSVVTSLIDLIRSSGEDAGMVVCGKQAAYIERHDPGFIAECTKYYANLVQVADLHEVDDEVIKLAAFDFGDVERGTALALVDAAPAHAVVVSGHHWADVMNQGVNKGRALQQLQAELGVTPAQTVVFGDYLNDLEMMDAADFSFAMANAHPAVIERANYLAPSNAEDGVMSVLRRLLA